MSHYCVGQLFTCSAPIQSLITISFQIGQSQNSQSGNQMTGLSLREWRPSAHRDYHTWPNEIPYHSRCVSDARRPRGRRCVGEGSVCPREEGRSAEAERERKPSVTYFSIGWRSGSVARKRCRNVTHQSHTVVVAGHLKTYLQNHI